MLLGIAAALGFNILQKTAPTLPQVPAYGYAGVGFGVAVMTFGMSLFVAWLFNLGMNILGGRVKFYEGLVVIAYPLKLFSIGVLISAVASYAGPAGGILSFIALSTFGILTYTSLFRMTREMFGVDMITAFIGVSALFAVIMMSVYGVAISGVMTSGFLPLMMQPPA